MLFLLLSFHWNVIMILVGLYHSVLCKKTFQANGLL